MNGRKERERKRMEGKKEGWKERRVKGRTKGRMKASYASVKAEELFALKWSCVLILLIIVHRRRRIGLTHLSIARCHVLNR